MSNTSTACELDSSTLRRVSKESSLDILINNAASQYPPVDELTSEGYDLQFGTNVLGHFYFTQLLLPALLSAARDSPDGKARVVHVASVGHEFVSGIDFDTLTDTPKRRTLHPTTLYFQSKFGNVLVANGFHRRYADQGLVSCSLHPGNLKFNAERHPSTIIRTMSIIVCTTQLGPSRVRCGVVSHRFCQNPLLPGPELGALTQLWAATCPEGVNFGGKVGRLPNYC